MIRRLRHLVAIVDFLFFYLREVIACNLRVAYDVMTLTHHMTPAFLELPTTGLTDRQLLALSNLISMTPGTISLDVASDGSSLSIHCMYATDPDTLLAELEHDYVRRVRRVF